MSEKELAMNLLEKIPYNKLGYVIGYLQGLTADEEIDDTFCEKLIKDYENAPDKGDFISFADAVKLCEVNPNDL